MNALRKLGLLLLGALVSGAAVAGASPQTTTFTVSATVPSNCTINSAGALNFGAYNVFSASDNTTTGTISVSCTKGTQITVALNKGSNSASFAPRTMKDATTNTLNYNLYTGATTSPGCTGATVWGDGTASTSTQTPAASTSKGTPITLTVNGCIPAGQDVAAGASESYSDTITVTVTFT